MAKEQINKPEEETLGTAMSKTENFFEQNSKMVTYCLVALLILAGCVFGYKKLISEPRIAKAAELMGGYYSVSDFSEGYTFSHKKGYLTQGSTWYFLTVLVNANGEYTFGKAPFKLCNTVICNYRY